MYFILLLACSDEEPKSLVSGYTSRDGYFVSYDTFPEPIPINEEFVLGVDVYLDDSQSDYPEGITVDVDAEMPEHGHGMNVQPEAISVSDGRFEAEGMLFHMTGYWEIIVYVNGDEGSEDIRFPVTLK